VNIAAARLGATNGTSPIQKYDIMFVLDAAARREAMGATPVASGDRYWHGS